MISATCNMSGAITGILRRGIPCMLAVAAVPVAFGQWNVTQLTDNAYPDTVPELSGATVVWCGHDGNDYEVFFYKGGEVIQLTDNAHDDLSPQVSGSYVAWYGGGPPHDVFFYDGTAVRQLTDDRTNDEGPRISGARVVWGAIELALQQDWWDLVMFKDGVALPLTDSEVSSIEPDICGSRVVWAEYEDDYEDSEIFLWDDGTIMQLTNDAWRHEVPQVSDSIVAWYGELNYSRDAIFVYDGLSVRELNTTGCSVFWPRVSGSCVVWEALDDTDWEVFLYDGDVILQLTDNDDDDVDVDISGSRVVWVRHSHAGSEVCVYDGHAVEQVTNDGRPKYRPRVSGECVVWEGDDGNDREIFLATRGDHAVNGDGQSGGRDDTATEDGDGQPGGGDDTAGEEEDRDAGWPGENDGGIACPAASLAVLALTFEGMICSRGERRRSSSSDPACGDTSEAASKGRPCDRP